MIIENEDDEIMISCAHRYCLGRRSYIVNMAIDFLMKVWDQIKWRTQFVILRDTVEALMDNNAGDNYDYQAWLFFVSCKIGELDDKQVNELKASVAWKGKPWII